MTNAIDKLFSARMHELGSNPPATYRQAEGARATAMLEAAIVGEPDRLRELESAHYNLAQAVARAMHEKGLQDGAALAGAIKIS